MGVSDLSPCANSVDQAGAVYGVGKPDEIADGPAAVRRENVYKRQREYITSRGRLLSRMATSKMR